jgi:hypothetical protein
MYGWMEDWQISMQNSFSYPVSKPESYWISLLFCLLITVVLTDVTVPRVETLTVQAPPPSTFHLPFPFRRFGEQTDRALRCCSEVTHRRRSELTAAARRGRYLQPWHIKFPTYDLRTGNRSDTETSGYSPNRKISTMLQS